jgi:hypothetical protein
VLVGKKFMKRNFLAVYFCPVLYIHFVLVSQCIMSVLLFFYAYMSEDWVKVYFSAEDTVYLIAVIVSGLKYS